MKIAIHHRPDSFSERWIEYCKKENIDYKIVNAYDNDIEECHMMYLSNMYQKISINKPN